MVLRIVVIVAVFALITVVQVGMSELSRSQLGTSSSTAGMFGRPLGGVAVAQNENDSSDNDDSNNDNSTNDNLDIANDGIANVNSNDNNGENDNGDENDNSNNDNIADDGIANVNSNDNDSGNDNNGNDNDNSGNDNGDSGNDNNDSDPLEDIVIENVSPPGAAPAAPAASAAAPVGPAAPVAGAVPSPAAPAAPVTEATGTSTGGDSTIALPDNRIAVQVFPWMPEGVTLTVRLIDPVTVQAAPGTRVGDLIFVLEARDSSGATLTMLPAEVNLSVTYVDRETGGLNDQSVTLSWLDPSGNQWTPAPKLVTDPAANVVAASVTQLGTYVVSIP